MATQTLKTIRLGRIRANVFAHSSDTGSTWYSASYSRSYKDEKGKTVYTDRFNEEDHPVIAKLAQKVTAYILEQRERQ